MWCGSFLQGIGGQLDALLFSCSGVGFSPRLHAGVGVQVGIPVALKRSQSLRALRALGFGLNGAPVVLCVLAAAVPPLLRSNRRAIIGLLNLDGGTKAQDSDLQLVFPKVVVVSAAPGGLASNQRFVVAAAQPNPVAVNALAFAFADVGVIFGAFVAEIFGGA